jgi:stringent starvation protein B
MLVAMNGMTSRQPYLIRAFYDWILDNGLTPFLSVDAEYNGVEVPHNYVVDGQIVLNISSSSVRNLELGLEYILFDARFSGQAHHIVIPVKAVRAIFAKENGEGMAFVYDQSDQGQESAMQSDNKPEEGGGETGGPDPTDPSPKPPGGGRPKLKVVK